VTSGHSFLFDGLLLTVGQLVNGASIVVERDTTAYDYSTSNSISTRSCLLMARRPKAIAATAIWPDLTGVSASQMQTT